MSDPAALIPYSRVARDLTHVARSLRLVRSGAGEGAVIALPDGRSSILDTRLDIQSSRFPIERINATTLVMPELIVDFHQWFPVPSAVVSFMPQSGDHWLSMAVAAAASTTYALDPNNAPVEVDLFPSPKPSAPIYVWRETALGIGRFETGVAAGGARFYYWNLVHVEDGVITQVPESVFFYGEPPHIFV